MTVDFDYSRLGARDARLRLQQKLSTLKRQLQVASLKRQLCRAQGRDTALNLPK